MNEIKSIQGLLPICAWCKKIRTNEGNWTPLEQYLSGTYDVDFTHGICPECYAKLSPES